MEEKKKRNIRVLKTGHEKRLQNVAKVTLYLHGVLLSMNYSFCFSFHQVCRYKTATKGQTATITMLHNHT